MIGKALNDEKIKKLCSRLDYSVVPGENYQCLVELGNSNYVSIDTIQATILKSIKNNVERYLRKPVQNLKAVISVPANFDSIQKQAVLDSANNAGF